MFIRLTLASMIAGFCCVSTVFAQTTVTFQQGVNGYVGTYDRLLNIANNRDGASVDTTTAAFFIDGDPEDSARADYLIRFEDIIGGSGIPVGAKVLKATLTLKTTSTSVSANSQSNECYSIYRLTRPFDSNSTMDGDFGNEDFAFSFYLDGVTPKVGSFLSGVTADDIDADWCVGTFDRPIGSTSMAVDQFYSADLTRAVQSWVDGDPNYGVAVISDHIDNDDGWSVHSTGSTDVAARPQLTVEYTLDPNVKTFDLQDGLNGYDGTTDLFLRETAASVDGSTVLEGFLDGKLTQLNSFDDPYMIKFDLSNLIAQNEIIDEIVSAELIFKTGISNGASDAQTTGGAGYSVHQLLQPFTTSSQYADFAGNSAAMILAGQIGGPEGLYEYIDEAEQVSVNVKNIVSRWMIDNEDNNGFYIGALNTDNGWQIFSSGAAETCLAPTLRVVVRTYVMGDANGDGFFDFGDIEPFVLALQDPDAFAEQYPNVNPNKALDFDGDDAFTFGDIEGFVNALLG
ncbi:MAG: DNRLRE domain-containing protein [Planctomycetaceae bacterium]|nr:DNRLRE domain-containing protein [Planctomycetaceae bacterium]